MKIFRKTTVEDEQKKQAVETRKEHDKGNGEEIRVFKERRKAGVSAKGEAQHAPKHRE